MGKPCVAGAEGIEVHIEHRLAIIGDKVVHGKVTSLPSTVAPEMCIRAKFPTIEPEFSPQTQCPARVG